LREGISPTAVVFTCVARFYPQKNVAGVVKAYARIAREPFLSTLLLAGDGPLRGEVVRLVSELGLTDQVRFLGIRRDIEDILSASDVFALASNWEGTPISIMEAMTAGLPVVATEVGGVPHCVRNGVTGLLVPPGNVEALAGALKDLARDGAKRAEMGRAGAKFASESFDAATMAKRYQDLYVALLGQRRA
jgi:glycosyltransferase involved in cell wall biosynthesis